MNSARIALFVAAMSVGALPTVARASQSFDGEYVVSFLGLSVARANFQSTIDTEVFALRGTLQSAGFGRFFDDTQGTVTSMGGFAGNRTEPARFRIDYTQKDKPTSTTIDFAGGAVSRTETIPPPRPRGADWVPVAPADLARVSDPLAATLIRADAPEKVCGRTVRVFDGEFRLDLALEPAGAGTASVEGYEGQTVTCRAMVKPVSGYRKGRRALEFLERRSRIMVSFAPLGTTGVYAPIHATVGTQIGTITIKARRFAAKQ